MNIIIVGCGKVGQKLIEQLSREGIHNITIVDIKHSKVQDIANEYDVMGVVGSSISVETMNEAGIKEADVLIAVTGSDELNMLTCLMAKKIGKTRCIARVRKPEYNKILYLFKEDLNLAMIINPELAAANEIARILRFPSAIQISTFAKSRVEILKFKIDENSPLNNIKVQDIVSELKCDVLVCGIERGDEAFIPGGSFVLKENDLVSVVVPLQIENSFFKKIGIKADGVKDTTIVGGGELSYYLAQKLSASGVEVKIIEIDPVRADELFTDLPNVTIINGDGTDNKLLAQEGIENCDSFVSCINIDEENVLLSLYAKTQTNGKIITKINRDDYGKVIDNLNLGTTIYPKTITAENILKFIRAKSNSHGSNVEALHYILDGKAEALEFSIKENSPVANVTIDKLNLKDNVLIACITRGTKVIIPRGKDVIMPGDTVIIVTLKSGFVDISDILR